MSCSGSFIRAKETGSKSALCRGATILLLLMACCSPPPAERSAKLFKQADLPAATCDIDGHSLTSKEVIDAAALNEINNMREGRKCVAYSDLDDFYNRNNSCCEVETSRTIEQEIAGETWPLLKGDFAGMVTIRYYCGSTDPNVGLYILAKSDVSRCGKIEENIRFPDVYRARFGRAAK